MDNLFINNDDAYKPMRDNAKQIIKKPSNVEDFELFEVTEKVQCGRVPKHAISSHWAKTRTIDDLCFYRQKKSRSRNASCLSKDQVEYYKAKEAVKKARKQGVVFCPRNMLT